MRGSSRLLELESSPGNNMHFERVMGRPELSALMMVTAVLMAGMLTKLGAIVVSLCLFRSKTAGTSPCSGASTGMSWPRSYRGIFMKFLYHCPRIPLEFLCHQWQVIAHRRSAGPAFLSYIKAEPR